jgi:hypothetical protein
MHAAVHEDVEVTVFVPSNDRGLGSDRDGLVVTGLGDLTFVSDEDPVALEDSLHFQIEDLRFQVDPAMDPGLLYQLIELQV